MEIYVRNCIRYITQRVLIVFISPITGVEGIVAASKGIVLREIAAAVQLERAQRVGGHRQNATEAVGTAAVETEVGPGETQAERPPQVRSGRERRRPWRYRGGLQLVVVAVRRETRRVPRVGDVAQLVICLSRRRFQLGLELVL